jgi:hypothetical protein
VPKLQLPPDVSDSLSALLIASRRVQFVPSLGSAVELTVIVV